MLSLSACSRLKRVAYLAEARCQRTIGTCYLIDIAITLEYLQCVLCKESWKYLFVDTHRVYEFHSREIVHHKLLARLRIHKMFAQGL